VGFNIDLDPPYKHFSTLKNIKLSLSRFGKTVNACYNQFTIEWDAMASKKVNDSLFFTPQKAPSQ